MPVDTQLDGALVAHLQSTRPQRLGLSGDDPRLDHLLANVGDLTFRRRILTILEYLRISDDDVVLDAGCGEGFYIMLLARLTGAKVVGIDNNPDLVAQARRWIGDDRSVKLTIGEIEHLPFADQTFSKIICSEVLEHVPDPVKALREVHRVLRDDGILAVTVPNHNYPALFDPLNWVREHVGLGHFSSDNEWLGGLWANHLRLYTAKELTEHIMAAGFIVDDMRALTRFCLPFHQLILYTGKQAYTRLPVPESVRVGMEKFEWQRVQPALAWHPAQVILRTGMGVLRAVDRLNERPFPLTGTAMHLAAKVRKA